MHPSYCLQCIAPFPIPPLNSPLTAMYLRSSRLQCAATYLTSPNHRRTKLWLSDPAGDTTPQLCHGCMWGPRPNPWVQKPDRKAVTLGRKCKCITVFVEHVATHVLTPKLEGQETVLVRLLTTDQTGMTDSGNVTRKPLSSAQWITETNHHTNVISLGRIGEHCQANREQTANDLYSVQQKRVRSVVQQNNHYPIPEVYGWVRKQ
ncbi:hypothetical protein CSKR_113966 [Clonorchis sinensis]|uniref:Uncharacterized protein n=1 Tax=Clonorchis sinensis TaxID=79923 RepID=A0A3R7CIN3_CLOSI|nr:hypothetical protein CSKR_113966 [Clonorchis sinensis]